MLEYKDELLLLKSLLFKIFRFFLFINFNRIWYFLVIKYNGQIYQYIISKLIEVLDI